MESHYASPERTDEATLRIEIETVTQSPVIDGLLRAVEGLVAVLDKNRQVLAVNHELLVMAGVEDPEQSLGLRAGELLGCVHAHETPAGCGTSRFCSTCGAAIATTTSLATGQPVERICAMQVERGGVPRDLYLSVRACPIHVSGEPFLLLFMQDISRAQQLAALERIFFHDVNNLLTGLVGTSEVLEEQPQEAPALAHEIATLARRLHQEIAIQRALTDSELSRYRPHNVSTTSGELLGELRNVYAHHPIARGLALRFDEASPVALEVDAALLMRVLSNMITNACEASKTGDAVVVTATAPDPQQVELSVWSAVPIQPAHQLRVFQRNYSTKGGQGRGLGTYSMKLLGESYLGGKVGFESNPAQGTRFWIRLPRTAAPRSA